MTDDSPPYPKARRAYRLLGLIHAPLFGAILAKHPFQNGEYAVAAVAFVIGAALTFGLFWHLANEHYRGDVPGKLGSLTYGGDDERR